MIKNQTLFLKAICRFSQRKQSVNDSQFSRKSVSSIIYNNSRDPSYVYRQTRSVCNAIKSLFQNLPEKEESSLQQLKKLFKAVHLSSFSSWKNLKQTSHFINYILNQAIPSRKFRFSQDNLTSICQVLDELNYDLQPNNDKNFISCEILQNVKQEDFSLISQQSLKILQAIFKHSSVLYYFESQKEQLQKSILKRISQSVTNENRNEQVYISSLVKSGIYSGFWDNQFLNGVANILESKTNLRQYESLLNTIKLNNKQLYPSQKQEWSQQNINNKQQSSNFVTQVKIHNILKEMDYNVEVGQRLFNFQVDFKLDQKSIVQYHGIHHYKINTQHPVETTRSRWKLQALKKRGYNVCVIPFNDWNRLQTIYSKKAWLIQKVQNQLFFSS